MSQVIFVRYNDYFANIAKDRAEALNLKNFDLVDAKLFLSLVEMDNLSLNKVEIRPRLH